MANDSSILIDGFEAEIISAKLNISNNGASHYVITQKNDPDITLERGKTYEFNIDSPGHPFWIKTLTQTGTSNGYSFGVENNGTSNGIITFKVPLDAPDQLYYVCQNHLNMNGKINIVDTNSSGVIVSDASSSYGGGSSGYSYQLELTFIDDTYESVPILFDI